MIVYKVQILKETSHISCLPLQLYFEGRDWGKTVKNKFWLRRGEMWIKIKYLQISDFP